MNEVAGMVLFALYAEANAKKPVLANVLKELKLESEELGRAVNSLYVGRLVAGVTVKFGEDDNSPVLFSTEDIVLTRRGVKQAEADLGLKPSASQIQKLQKLVKLAEQRRWPEVKAIAAKSLQEQMAGLAQ